MTKNTRHRLMIKLMNEKVVTEHDLLKITNLDAIDNWYKEYSVAGYPIMRKTIDQKWCRTHRPLTNHRNIIYYLL